MNYYIDTEFVEGTQPKNFLGVNIGYTKPTIDLISIGIVRGDGRCYYAVSSDFNLKNAWNIEWIRDNVLHPIFLELVEKWKLEEEEANYYLFHTGYNDNIKFSYRSMKEVINRYGLPKYILKKQITDFLKYDNNPVFYGYFSAYDWVALCWIFDKMMSLPSKFPWYCIDLKHELDLYINAKRKDDVIARGFNSVLKEIKSDSKYPSNNNVHNSLSDANWIRQLHDFIKTL